MRAIVNRARTVRAVVAATIAACVLVVTGSMPAGAEAFPVDNSLISILWHRDPDVSPPGANDWTCRPSAAHRQPVVLVHGFVANQNANWYALSPTLANEDYCVFTFNYGDIGWPTARGLARVEDSAPELADFVERVRAETGARKVDIVAHSLGTVVTHYYIKNLGGDRRIDDFVSLSGNLSGSTYLGLAPFARLLGLDDAIAQASPVIEQLAFGSAFLAELNAGGVLRARVRYTAIVSRYDELNTPYWAQFLPPADNTTNLLLQDACPLDFSGHVRLAFSPNALRLVLNTLDPAHARSSCQFVI
jgi:triacylglycerol esterase/lipase EstA (alpha/beta hydrolase family)